MKICIVGAGMTGLTAGSILAGKGHEVTVLESGSQYGGLVDAMLSGGESLERIYHHIFTSDSDITGLIEELGLTEGLKWREPKNGMYINGRLYPFTSPLDLLRFKELSFLQRISMGLLVYRARFVKDWKVLEGETAEQWITRNAGSKVYEKVWRPLMNSKFDRDSTSVSAVWIWNKFKLRGSTRGRNINRELLGYLDGSFSLVCRRLVQIIKDKGGQVLTEKEVTGIEQQGNGMLKVCTKEGCESYDRVIFTAAPGILAGIASQFSGEYREKLLSIKYKANICMVMETKQRLSPYYWITVADEDSPFVLVVEHTNLIDDKRYGSHIVYLSRYLDQDSRLYSMLDDGIKSLFTSHLKKLFPDWDEASVKNIYITRSRYAQPVVGTGYSKILPGFRTPVEGLYLASMAQIYPEDRGMNYAVRMGRDIARMVLEDIDKAGLAKGEKICQRE